MAMKKTSLYFLLFSVSVLLLFASCRKDAPDLVNPNMQEPKSFTEQFQAVWEGMDNSYVFWDVDTVDWDARYDECLHIFEGFDARGAGGTVTDEELLAAWTKVFSGLLDHHLVAAFWNPRNQVGVRVSPGNNSYSHDNYFKRQVELLKSQPGMTEMVYNEDSASGPIAYACLLPGKASTGNKIAYFRFNGFEYEDETPAAGLAPLHAFFGSSATGMTDRSYANRSDVESIIIDLRGNGGGIIANITTYLATLLQEPTRLGYSRFKEGSNRLDHSPWTPITIDTTPHHLNAPKPIVVLSDINSVSCAELTTLLIKSLPNGTFIGERTYGGTGALLAHPNYHCVFYDGGFGDTTLYNHLLNKKPMPRTENYVYYVYTSTYEVVDINHNNLEGKGVQPDIEVLFDADQLTKGHDNQLDRALEYLRK